MNNLSHRNSVGLPPEVVYPSQDPVDEELRLLANEVDPHSYDGSFDPDQFVDDLTSIGIETSEDLEEAKSRLKLVVRCHKLLEDYFTTLDKPLVLESDEFGPVELGKLSYTPKSALGRVITPVRQKVGDKFVYGVWVTRTNNNDNEKGSMIELDAEQGVTLHVIRDNSTVDVRENNPFALSVIKDIAFQLKSILHSQQEERKRSQQKQKEARKRIFSTLSRTVMFLGGVSVVPITSIYMLKNVNKFFPQFHSIPFERNANEIPTSSGFYADSSRSIWDSDSLYPGDSIDPETVDFNQQMIELDKPLINLRKTGLIGVGKVAKIEVPLKTAQNLTSCKTINFSNALPESSEFKAWALNVPDDGQHFTVKLSKKSVEGCFYGSGSELVDPSKSPSFLLYQVN